MALSPFNHKSSVLCPKTKHITTQYLALEQIEAHHKMVYHAKHNLDTAIPKSMKSYISNVDRKKNSWLHETAHRYPSTFKNSDEILQNNKNLLGSENFEEDKETMHTSMSLNKSIQTGITYPTLHSKVADKISWYLEAVSQGEFQSQTLNRQNLQKKGTRHYGSQISLSSSLHSYRVIKGDLIEWHKNHFTSAKKSFSPRILADNSVKSKVRDMRCYNPPQTKASHYSGESSESFDSYDDVEEEVDGKENETRESSNNENDSSIRNSDVDHQTWPSERSLEVNIHEKLRTKFKHQSCMANMLQSDNHAQNKRYPFSALHAFNRNEDNYLKFLADVTEDILRSGVYSDRAIQQTFEFHLQFCSENSDKEKLQHLLDQMLEGLEVRSDDNEDLLNESIPVKNDNIFIDRLIDKQIDDQKNTRELKIHGSDLPQVGESSVKDSTSKFSLNLVHSDAEINVNSKFSKDILDDES